MTDNSNETDDWNTIKQYIEGDIPCATTIHLSGTVLLQEMSRFESLEDHLNGYPFEEVVLPPESYGKAVKACIHCLQTIEFRKKHLSLILHCHTTSKEGAIRIVKDKVTSISFESGFYLIHLEAYDTEAQLIDDEEDNLFYDDSCDEYGDDDDDDDDDDNDAISAISLTTPPYVPTPTEYNVSHSDSE